MSESVDININSRFDASGTQAAARAFQKLADAREKSSRAADKALADTGNDKLAKAAQKAAQEVTKAEQAYLRAARAEATLASASGNAAGAINILSGALQQVDRNTVSAVGAQTQLTRAMRATEGSGLGAKISEIGGELGKMATGFLAAGAAVEGAKALFESFGEAFNWKANLDATTSAVNLQLRGMRDSTQVWASAQAYAQKYKLTQEETANAVRASVAIFRSSNASVEDTLGVLQRLTVLAPGKSIEDAAFSMKELASGDITSIAEQFDISRKNAYAMRDAINGGADVVSVLAKYLDDAGVSMDTLKVKTEGVLGAQKDLLIAQEDLKKAQAEWAQGPGLAILQAQILATRGTTRTLAGDWEAMAESQQKAIAANPALKLNPLYMAMAKAIELAAQKQREFNAAQAASREQRIDDSRQAGLASLKAAYDAGTISSAQYSAAVANLTAQHDALLAGTTSVTAAVETATDATDRHTEAQQRAAQAAAQRESAIKTVVAGLVDQAAKEVMGEEKANALYAIQSSLAAIGDQVRDKHITAGEGAIILAQQYGIAIDQARLLLDLQMRISGGNTRIAAAQGGFNDLSGVNPANRAPQGVGYNAPGRQGTGDVDAAIKGYQEAKKATDDAKAAQEAYNLKVADHAGKLSILRGQLSKATVGSKEYYDILGQISDEEGRAAKGADKRANAEASVSARILAIARKTGDELIAIDKRVAEEREKNLRALAASIETSSADMVAAQEADDLDLVGASAEQADKLRAREEAEASARVAEAKAVEEARATSAAGDAETAAKVYDIRQKQIADQQSLDEKYYARRAELAGDDKAQAELKQQYDEATQAAQDATDVRIKLAQDEAAQKAAAVAAEKQAVLDKASAEAAALDATGKAGSVAADRVARLAELLAGLPAETYTRITVEEVHVGGTSTSAGGGSDTSKPAGGSAAGAGKAGGGAKGSVKAAGGGTFATHGPTTFTVGDNPGGVELVSVTPISGAGTTSVHGNSVHMAGGGQAAVDSAADSAERRLKGGTTPTLPTGGGGTKHAAEVAAKDQKDAKAAIADYAKAARDNLDLLNETLKLRQVLNDPATWAPIPESMIRGAAADADKVARAFADIAATYDTKVLESAKTYSDALKGAFDVIKDGLETFDRLRGSDIVVPESQLRAFESSASGAVAMVSRLGAQAAAIPQDQVTALGNLAASLAVLPSLGMIGGLTGGGGSGDTNMGGVQIAIYQQPGQDANALANLVLQKLGGAVSGRR